jgi:hypothetical protein
VQAVDIDTDVETRPTVQAPWPRATTGNLRRGSLTPSTDGVTWRMFPHDPAR